MIHKHHASASVPAALPIMSGALSHAYLHHPPLRFVAPGAAGCTYDDGNKLILVPAPNKVLSWLVTHKSPPDDPIITNIAEGPVLFVRFALDETILAVQRSGQEVEFISRETGVSFRQRCRHATDQILGLFWSDCPTCDLVFVTSSGLELYSLAQDRTGLKYIEARRLNVSWYVYTHESRLVLLASGMQCKTLSGFQFSAGGIIRLPKFDVEMDKTEENSKPVLSLQDVHIATMYGRIYCLQFDRVARWLRLYRFYRDAVEPQGFLPVYSGHVALSVVDNVLLIHEIDAKVVLLYDVMLDSKNPISAPLPLLLRRAPSYPQSRTTSQRKNSNDQSSVEVDHLNFLAEPESIIYDSGWIFANPNIVFDHAGGFLWNIHLDLEAISASASDILILLAFLQRRSHEANKAKLLSIEIIRSMIIERQPLPLIARAMDILTSSYAQAVKEINMANLSAVNKSAQLINTGGSRISATIQAPREFDIVAATLPDSVVQAVQQTSNKKKLSVVYLDVEPHTSRQAHGTHGRQIVDSSAADGHLHEILQKTASVVPLGGLSSHEPLSELGETSGRSGEQIHAEILAAELSESEGTISPTISPEEMHQNIFCAIEKDMIVESTFLVATIIEYLHRCLMNFL